jgi:hypothetical protein
MSSQFSLIVSAVERTLESLKAGPGDQGNKESYTNYLHRIQAWDQTKRRFALFGINCLRHYDLDLAIHYSRELRKMRPLV